MKMTLNSSNHSLSVLKILSKALVMNCNGGKNPLIECFLPYVLGGGTPAFLAAAGGGLVGPAVGWGGSRPS